jgi:hypothetical protein
MKKCLLSLAFLFTATSAYTQSLPYLDHIFCLGHDQSLRLWRVTIKATEKRPTRRHATIELFLVDWKTERWSSHIPTRTKEN